MFTSGRSRSLAFLLTIVMVLSLTPLSAFGSVFDPPSGISTTNPSYPGAGTIGDNELPHPDDFDFSQSWWRRNWGSSERPHFVFNDPDPGIVAGIEEFYYLVDHSPTTTLSLNPADIPNYYHSTPDASTSSHEADINIVDVFLNDAPPGGWTYSHPGQRLAYEGQWYMHLLWVDMAGNLYPTHHIPVGVDLTPPLAVSKITARPSTSYVGPTDQWFPTRRAHVSWEDKEYDALSGVAKYDVYIDGEYAGQQFHAAHIYTSATIEDMSGGKHVIDVYAVDKAGNVGPGATTFFYSDPDTPTVEITAPTDGGQMGVNATFKVDAFDEAGIQWVDFAIDGVSFYTDTVAPYQFTKNMSAYSAGTHTITAKTKDMYGREVSTTHTFTLDKTVPVVGSVSDYPDPFYPVLTDGYKDTMAVSFWCNEGGTATLKIYDSTGQVYATRSKSIGSGWQSVTWDGVSKYGKIGVGTFRYTLTVTDAGGNAATAGYYTTSIYDYEIIRIAPNAVQVVPR